MVETAYKTFSSSDDLSKFCEHVILHQLELVLDQTQLDQTQSGKAPNFAPEEDELRACVLFGCFPKTWKYSVPEVLKTYKRRLQFVYLLATFHTRWGQVTKLRPLQMAFQTNAGTLYCTRSYCGGDLRNISANRKGILQVRPITQDRTVVVTCEISQRLETSSSGSTSLDQFSPMVSRDFHQRRLTMRLTIHFATALPELVFVS